MLFVCTMYMHGHNDIAWNTFPPHVPKFAGNSVVSIQRGPRKFTPKGTIARSAIVQVLMMPFIQTSKQIESCYERFEPKLAMLPCCPTIHVGILYMASFASLAAAKERARAAINFWTSSVSVHPLFRLMAPILSSDQHTRRFRPCRYKLRNRLVPGVFGTFTEHA